MTQRSDLKADDVDALFDQAFDAPAGIDGASAPNASGDDGSRSMAQADHAAAVDVAASASTADDAEHGAVQAGPNVDPQLFEQIGRLTRSLHESLRELGYDKAVDRAADALPDARDRLNYIASLTGKAADRTLTRVELAQPIQETLGRQADELQARWQHALADQAVPESLRGVIEQTLAYLGDVPSQTRQTNEHLLDIMMAQDFHDLTGQVIKKVIGLANDVEEQLLTLLVHSGHQRKVITQIDTQMNGPVIDPTVRTDVVTGQQQVDDLLGQLGF